MNTRKTILVAEDVKISRQIICMSLQDKYDIVEVENGVEALEVLRSSKTIDLVVLDLVMPIMDGFAFLKMRKEEERLLKIPVIVVTASDYPENEVKALDFGADDLIGKPFDRRVLLKRIENVLKVYRADYYYKENLILQENKILKEQYEALINGTTGGIFRAEFYYDKKILEGKIIFINSSFFKLRNVEVPKDCTKTAVLLIGLDKDDYISVVDRIKEKVLQHERAVEWTYRVKDIQSGATKLIHCLCGIEYEKDKAIINVIETDITSQVVGEVESQSVSKQIQQLVDNVPGGVAIFEVHDGIARNAYFNEGLCKMLGYTYEEYRKMIADDMYSLVHPDDLEDLVSIMRRAVDKKIDASATYRLLKKNKKYKWVTLHVNIIEEREDLVIFYGIYSDVDQLKLQAEKDPLTGLCNRSTFETFVNMYFKGGPSKGKNTRMAAMFMIDIDNFKSVNDMFGHAVGDEVLIELGEKIHDIFREEDKIARLGGDEFAVFVSHKIPDEIIRMRAMQICDAVACKYNVGEREKTISLSCSVGVAIAPLHGNSFLELYRKADKAQYFAKRSGKNRYCVFGDTEKVIDAVK